MDFIVQNIRGAKSYKKILTLKNNFKDSNCTMLCLTETALKSHETTNFAHRFGFGHFQDNIYHDIDTMDPNSHRGVTIVLNKKHEIKNLAVKTSGQGDFIILSGSICKRHFVMGVVYGHASPSDILSQQTIKRFCQSFENICSKLNNPQMNVTGDFNFILRDSDVTTKANYSRKPLTESYFSNFIAKYKLLDIHEALFPDMKTHTYKRSTRGVVTCTSRLD